MPAGKFQPADTQKKTSKELESFGRYIIFNVNKNLLFFLPDFFLQLWEYIVL
jgi:hypothetical protein